MILPPVKQEDHMDKLAYFLTGVLTGIGGIIAAVFYFSDNEKASKTKTDTSKTEAQKTPENQPGQQINPEDILSYEEEKSESEQKIPTEPTVNPS